MSKHRLSVDHLRTLGDIVRLLEGVAQARVSTLLRGQEWLYIDLVNHDAAIGVGGSYVVAEDGSLRRTKAWAGPKTAAWHEAHDTDGKIRDAVKAARAGAGATRAKASEGVWRSLRDGRIERRADGFVATVERVDRKQWSATIQREGASGSVDWALAPSERAAMLAAMDMLRAAAKAGPLR